jgi:hypothetical protein
VASIKTYKHRANRSQGLPKSFFGCWLSFCTWMQVICFLVSKPAPGTSPWWGARIHPMNKIWDLGGGKEDWPDIVGLNFGELR